MNYASRNDAALISAGLVLACGAALVLAPSALLAVLILPALVVGAIFVRGTFVESKYVIYGVVFLASFMVDAVFRTRETFPKDVDFQNILKIGTWCIIAFVAAVHTRQWLGQMLLPSNVPVLMLLCWLLFTTTVSPIPAYTVTCAFSVCAYTVFYAYIFSRFDRVEIFAVMVLAILVFCVVSIVVYFAVPEFGRFVYWVNEQRYVSLRMAGIGGSANGMGRLAAFGLILIILYAKELRAIHRWLVPVATPVLAISLILTNSRTSMGMVAALWAAIYLFRLRKLYLALLGISVLVVIALVLIPAGDEAFKLISRSGDVSEVTSVTGRSTIWHAIPALVEARPWTGYGYASSITVLPEHAREVGFSAPHAHNVFLQLLLTTGWVGLSLFVLSLFTLSLRLLYNADRTALVMLAYVILNGLTESSAFSTLANICTVAFAIAVTLPSERSPYENDYSHQRGFS